MANVTVNQGTQTAVKTDTVGGVEYQVVKVDVGAAGASSLFTNTLGTVQNLNNGTLSTLTTVSNLTNGTVRVSVGTIAAGTINAVAAGTVCTYGLPAVGQWGTIVSTGTNTLGTIKAAVSGSAIYVTDLMVSVGSASNVVIASGGTSTPIAGTFFLNANGGLVSNFNIPISTASGSALVYQQSTGCQMTITATGYVK